MFQVLNNLKSVIKKHNKKLFQPAQNQYKKKFSLQNKEDKLKGQILRNWTY